MAVCAVVGAWLVVFMCAFASTVSGALAVWFFFRLDLQWAAVHLAAWTVILAVFLLSYAFIIHLLGRVTALEMRVDALHRWSAPDGRSPRGYSPRGSTTGGESDVSFKRIEKIPAQTSSDSDLC